MKGFIFILLISSSIIAQERKIEKHVYINFNQGNIDLALEELEKLSPKYETEAFFYYWKAYIYIEKLNAYKKNPWIESDRNRCINLIKSIKEFLDNASLRLTKDQLKIDKEEFNILFPGCDITPPNNEKKYTNCVDLLKSKFIQLKVSMDELISNLSFEALANKRIEVNNNLNELILLLKPKIATNYPANPLLGEINKELFLKAVAARNNLELKKMEQDKNDVNWLNYLRTKTAEEYLSIVPQIEALINNYFLQKLEDEYDKVKNNVYALTSYLSNLEESKNFLEANPNSYFSSKYTSVNLSNTFKNSHKANYYVVINKAKVQQQENFSRQKLFENEIDYSQVIEDNFDQNVRGWYLSENETVINKIANGKFIFENKYDGGYINIASIRMPTNIDNFIFSMNTTWISGIDNHSYDIVWGANGFTNLYTFGISANGSYRLRNNGQGKDIIPWTSSNHINRNGSNVIGVKKNGSIIELYINHFKVNQTEFPQFYGDQLGMYINGKQRVEFDDMKVAFSETILGGSSDDSTDGLTEEERLQNDEAIELGIMRDSSRLANQSENEEKFHKDGYGPVIKDIDGNNYKTVYIGTQEWMAENLRVTKFRNGDPIHEAKSISEWINASQNKQPVWCYYNNDIKKGLKYGKLYNWYAVNDSRGLAPEGWHVPSNDEWEVVENHLDIDQGKKMKSVSGWAKDENGTDESGFHGLPGGRLFGDGSSGFNQIGESCFWWSITRSSEQGAYIYSLLGSWDTIFHDSLLYDRGCSVRCIKD